LNVSLQKSNKMLEQELKDIWNNSSQSGQISIETNLLREELNTKINSIQKKIRIRDVREIVASIFGILIFSYLLYEIPFPITKVACGFAIAWFVFVILKFRKSKTQNTKTNFSLTVAEQLNHQKTMMLQQSSLLDSALYWYAIPPFIMNFIFIIGLENPTDYNWTNSVAESLLPLTSNFKIITLIGLALFYAFTFWINKRALNKDVKPTIESIETMQQQIKNE
jgi:positive regulator of sigma E activity